MTYPCMLVKDGEIRIIGTSLLKDGRYPLNRAALVGVKTQINGETVVLHPDDVEFLYLDTP
jgi:hypothetical protein